MKQLSHGDIYSCATVCSALQKLLHWYFQSMAKLQKQQIKKYLKQKMRKLIVWN